MIKDKPQGVQKGRNDQKEKFDAYSGQGSAAGCPNAVELPYIRGSEPAPGAACGAPAPQDNVMDWVRGWLN